MRTVYHPFDRPSRDTVRAFDAVLREYSPSCLVADAHPEVGVIGGLRSVDRTHKIVGTALTVAVPPDDLVDILPVLGTAEPGDVVIVACHGVTHMAMWGGVMATLAGMAGIGGAVVDGAIRDVDELRHLGFPIWYRNAMPRRCPPVVPELAKPVQVNAPVIVDGATIRPGDIVVADENGVGIVPPALAELVVKNALELVDREQVMRDRITAGLTLRELLAEFGHL